MEQSIEKRDEYIQVGVTALRDPATNEYLPAVPLYVRTEDMGEEAQEALISDLGKLFAEKMRGYIGGCRKAGVEV